MKGPGAIILIGMAVVLIVIGATDRAKDVWDAIKGVTGLPSDSSNGGTSGGTTPDTTPSPPRESHTLCTGDGEMEVSPVAGEAPYCCPSSEVGGSSKGSVCPSGYTQVTYTAMKGQTAIQYGCVRLNTCHPRGQDANNTGQGGYGSMNVAQFQTGFTGFRYAPNP